LVGEGEEKPIYLGFARRQHDRAKVEREVLKGGEKKGGWVFRVGVNCATEKSERKWVGGLTLFILGEGIGRRKD